MTPQLTETNRKLVASRKLEFEVLYDENNQFADRLDLKHGFPSNLKEVYGKFGIDVAAANGSSEWELPIPARFVVDQSGIVRSSEFDADYTTRPEPTATLDILRTLG